MVTRQLHRPSMLLLLGCCVACGLPDASLASFAASDDSDAADAGDSIAGGAGAASSASSPPPKPPKPTEVGCEICATTGDCSRAFLDSPGQYCGDWLDWEEDTERCCCPPGEISTCTPTERSCQCSVITSAPVATVDTGKGSWTGNDNAAVGTAGWLVLVLGALLLVIASAWCGYRKARRSVAREQKPTLASQGTVLAADPALDPDKDSQMPWYCVAAVAVPMPAPSAPLDEYDYEYATTPPSGSGQRPAYPPDCV